MVNSINLSKVNETEFSKYTNYLVNPVTPVSNEDISIFESANDTSITAVDDESILALEEQLASVQEEQGCIMNAWDGLKGAIGLGASSEKCEDAIDKFKKGEISYEEALAEIEKFDTKQSNSLDLFANITTGVGAVVAATAAAAAIVASGGTATPLVLAAVGAGTGAVAKAGFKTIDRATNDVKDDALNAKQIAKDALSGSVTGTIGALTMGTGSATSSLGGSVAKSAVKSMKTGAITGSVSGSSNYLIETAFEEDKKFNTKDFLVNTATGAAVGTTVGGIMGSSYGAMKYSGIVKHGGGLIDQSGKYVAENATKAAVVDNAVNNAGYKVANRAIRDLGAAVAA